MPTTIAILVVTSVLSSQAPAGPCANPKAAVSTWLANLQDDSENPAAAATCTVTPAGMTDEEVQSAVVDLKRVFDARGIIVRVDELPEDPLYRDPLLGQHKVPVSTLLPEIYLVRSGERWVLSSSSLEKAPELYRETFPLDFARLLEELPAWTRVPVLGIRLWQVVGLALLVLLGFVARLITTHIVTSQVMRLFERFRIEWGRDLIKTNAVSIGTLALAGVVGLGVPSLGLSVGWAKITLLGVRVTAAVSVVVLLYRLVDVVAAWLMHRAQKSETKLDDQLVPLVRRGLRIITVLAGVVFVLQNLEVNVGSLLATLGIGTLAFALAAQDTVKNLFGSITIFLDKPFQIGDWVVVSGVEGIVAEVGFRSTRIRTFYNSVVTVPNAKFTDAIVDNYGLREYRRCYTNLHLPYHTTPDQLEAFCSGVRAIIQAHPLTRKDYYEVHVSGFAENGYQVMLYFFFKVDSWTDELRARHEVFLDITRLANDLGVSFALPTRTLHVETQAAPTPREPPRSPTPDELAHAVERFAPGGERVLTPGPRVGRGYFVQEPPPARAAKSAGAKADA